MAGFVFLNVLVMLLMVRFIPGYCQTFVRKVHNSDVNSNTRHVYLSLASTGDRCALVLFFLAMVLCLFDLWLSILYLFNGNFITLVICTCISTKLVVTVVEVIVCAIVCKRNPITVHIPFQWCITNVLFCCCCCCCCSTHLKSKVVQTLALWGNMVFVQHITASLIPVCHAIILQPAELLSILALFASTVFCSIMFVAHLLLLGHEKKGKDKETGYQERTAVCVQMVAIALFIGLAIVMISVYLLFLADGFEFSGLGGFVGSLIPSVILSAAGWYVKTRFLDTKSTPDPNQLTQPTALNPTTEPDQHGATDDGVLETAVVHRNAPDRYLESDGERTPLVRNTN